MRRQSIRPLDAAVFIFVMIIWGMNVAIAKIGVAQIPPMLMTAMRFALAAAVLVPFVPRPDGQWRAVMLVSVTLGFVHFAMMFTGLRGIDAATAAIAIQLQVPFASLLAAFVFNDKLGWRRAGGMAVAFAGVAIIAGEPRLQGSYVALALVIGGALIWAVASIQVKRMEDLSSWTISGWMSLFAAPQLLVASLLLEHGHLAALATADWRGWFAVVYNALAVMVLGYGIWYWLLRRYDVNQAVPFTLLIPVIGVAGGVLLLGERLTPTMLLGGGVALVGVAIIVLRRPRVADPAAERV